MTGDMRGRLTQFKLPRRCQRTAFLRRCEEPDTILLYDEVTEYSVCALLPMIYAAMIYAAMMRACSIVMLAETIGFHRGIGR